MAAPQLVCVCVCVFARAKRARAFSRAPANKFARLRRRPAWGVRAGAACRRRPSRSESCPSHAPVISSLPRPLISATSPYPATSPHPHHVPPAGRTRTRMPGWSRRGPPGCSSSTCGAAETPPHVPASRPRLTSPPHVPSSRTLLTSPSHVPFTRPLPPQLVDVRCGGGGAPARAARSVFETVFERARSRFETFLKGFESPRTVWGVSQALGRR